MLPAVAVAIAGQGMALSSHYIVQVAPSLSAKSAGIDTALVADKALVLSLVAGIVAIALAYFLYRKTIRSKDDPLNEAERSEEHTSELQSRGHIVCRLLLEKKNYRGYNP